MEVDKVTGKVDVLKVVAVHDVGKAVFREGIEGQIQGGVAMGLGYALSEEVVFSDGRPLNDSFLDYRLPTMRDVPQIVPVILEKENPRSPDDIRGVGEPTTIPTAASRRQRGLRCRRREGERPAVDPREGILGVD